jgi:hypothetical protein
MDSFSHGMTISHKTPILCSQLVYTRLEQFSTRYEISVLHNTWAVLRKTMTVKRKTRTVFTQNMVNCTPDTDSFIHIRPVLSEKVTV